MSENDTIVEESSEIHKFADKDKQHAETSKQVEDEQIDSEQTVNAVINYILNLFHPTRTYHFLSTLSEDNVKFIQNFCLGFEGCLGRPIYGVYDPEYIKSMKLTDELLGILNFHIRTFKRKEDGLSFSVVWRKS